MRRHISRLYAPVHTILSAVHRRTLLFAFRVHAREQHGNRRKDLPREWRARFGDISRFEPTKSLGTDTTQNVRKTYADRARETPRLVGLKHLPAASGSGSGLILHGFATAGMTSCPRRILNRWQIIRRPALRALSTSNLSKTWFQSTAGHCRIAEP